jgi:hypothetical protein
MRRLVEPSLRELLDEPIVRQLMVRDGTSERQVRAIALRARRRIEQGGAGGPAPRSRRAGDLEPGARSASHH